VNVERKLAALELAQRAKTAARELLRRDRKQLVLEAAGNVEKRAAEILGANEVDVANAANHPAAFVDRLRLDDRRIEGLAEQVEAVAAIDPLEREIDSWTLPNGPIGTSVCARRLKHFMVSRLTRWRFSLRTMPRRLDGSILPSAFYGRWVTMRSAFRPTTRRPSTISAPWPCWSVCLRRVRASCRS